MKVEMIKNAGGLLSPANDLESEKLTKFKTGEQYTVEIKQQRNAAFHRKVFAFFNFCYEHYDDPNSGLSHQKQFDVFRENLTCLAGYYDSFVTLSGSTRVSAKSISYAAMSQYDFEQFYIALTNAAIKYIFRNSGAETYNKLISFF